MRRLWRFLSGAPRRRHLLAPGLLVGMLLAVGACGVPAPGSSSGPSSVYFAGGALNAQNGATRWTGYLGDQPPILADGVLYMVTSPSATQGQAAIGVEAMRASDGKVLWTARVPYAEGPLVLAGDRLIAPAAQVPLNQPGTLTLTALRTSDGGVLWQSAPITVQSRPTVDTPQPIISNLAVSNGLVVGMAASSSESYIIAWHLSDGTVAWRQPLGGSSAFAGPTGTVHATGTTLTITYGDIIVGLDAASGKRIWPDRVIGGSLDVATASIAVISALDVRGLRPSDGTMLWRQNFGGELLQLRKLAASDSAVFYLNLEPCLSQQCVPTIYAISIADGSILWHRTLAPADPHLAVSAAYGNGTLYYAFFQLNPSGTRTLLIALRATDGTLAWTHSGVSADLAHAVVSNGLLYAFGTGTGTGAAASCTLSITALRTSDGSLAWQQAYTPCPHFSFSRPWFLVT